MYPAETGLSLVTWQGWGVLSVIAALTALLATVLAWLLPFPDRSLNTQLNRYDDRMALMARLGAAPPFKTYLVTLRRFNEWIMEWFGAPLSVQAFERCLAIAFIFPVALLLITLIANGLGTQRIALWQAGLFAAGFAIIAYVIAVAFQNLLSLIERAWMAFGGDQAIAMTIAKVVLGGFAFMVAFSMAFSIASAFSGQVSDAGSVLGAMGGGFVLAVALALAFALAGTTLFSITVAILAGAGLAFASEFTLLLLLFFILLPLTNASVDWLSWSATRFLLTEAERAEPDFTGRLKVLGAFIATFASGAFFMVVLAALLPNMLELLNVAFGTASLPRFNWEALAGKAVAAPWGEGLFVTGMLMTAMVPASAHLIVGLAGVLARFTPGARMAAHAIAQSADAPFSPKEHVPIKITLILSRAWYGVAALLTLALFAGANALIEATNAPVAAFLGDVALCATSWSHGKCVLF